MRALRGWRPPMIVIRVGIGVVMAAALSVAVVAETTAASSAGRHHGRSSEPKSHRQRVNHFNVGATHSPKLLRQLHGHHENSGNGPLLGSARADTLQGVDVASYQHPNGEGINWARAAKAGVQFVAVKTTEGTYYRNPFALTDLAQAKAAGLSVMAYVFAIPNGNGGSGSATAQADYLIKDLARAAGRMPPIMLDIEYNPYGAIVDRAVQRGGTGQNRPGADHLRAWAMVAGLHRRDFALRTTPPVGPGLHDRVEAGASERLE